MLDLNAAALQSIDHAPQKTCSIAIRIVTENQNSGRMARGSNITNRIKPLLLQES